MLTITKPATSDLAPIRPAPLPAELDFYSSYDWCLDPHLTVGETIEHLIDELERLPGLSEAWQTDEVMANAYLLSCSLLNGIDEYLRGHTLRLPAQLAKTMPGRLARWATEKAAETLPKPGRAEIRRWKQDWENALDGFFAVLAGRVSDRAVLSSAAEQLSAKLRSPLPSDLRNMRLGIPSAFSRLNLTHFDVLSLGRQLAGQFPDKSHPILFLGLRTAGTYMAALLRSSFKAEDYRQIAALTVNPKKGPSPQERKALVRYAEQGFTLVIVDDPPRTGGAVILATEIARKAGFSLTRIKALLPIDHTAQGCADTWPERLLIALEPQTWRKPQLLDPKKVESRLAEYFSRRGFSKVRVVDSRRTEAINAGLEGGSNRIRGTSLKRIFEVQLRTPRGTSESRYVLAESVGLGYLGYPAFLAAHRLSEFVPPVLGLRDGILYSEWSPQHVTIGDVGPDRDAWIDRAASYIAARTRLLKLPKQRAPGKAAHENGLALLAQAFGRAYGRILVDIPMRSRIQQQLYRLPCPFPTLIDGNMGRTQWIDGDESPLKTDYHRHGQGKTELNVIDPAYDLAETILHLSLSPEEEGRLIQRYIEASGDAEVRQRLLISKILAGLWAMQSAQKHLFDTMQTDPAQQELHRQYLDAWDFLTRQTARFCGARCKRPEPPRWRAPLVVLDVDGVIDRRVFGYPCTTAAGMKALSLLATHGYSVALNTARSAAEVKEYCHAYGLAGGVAEHGAYLWDAVAQVGQPLLDQETMRQLDEVREHLRRIPGVFLDSRHHYSIRAFTFEEEPGSLPLRLMNSMRSFHIGEAAPKPLPTLTVNHLLTSLRLDRLSFHHTVIDTAIVAKGADKGTGLTALRDRALGPDAETIAVGDTKADLPMFRAATHSSAPAQISCRREARLLGCVVSGHRFQRGLLDIVQTLVDSGPGSGTIENIGESDGEALFLNLLQAADSRNVRVLIRALFDRDTFKIFVR